MKIDFEITVEILQRSGESAMYLLELKAGPNIKEIEDLYLKASDYRTAQRLQAIYLRAKGKTPPEIATIIGRHADTVRNWIKLFNEGGPGRLEYKHSGGRTGKLIQEQEQRLAGWLIEGRPEGGKWTLKALKTRLFEEYGVNISQQQVSEKVIRLGLSHLISRPRRKSFNIKA